MASDLPATIDARFDTVRSEWVELVRRERELEAERVVQWTPRIEALRAECDDLRSRGRWVGGPADLMSVLGLARSEVHHSAAVAWLLNPAGRHRLGTTLLGSLLEHCFGANDYGPLSTARTACEVGRSHCIADVVVWADEFTLVIENKVDAVEGHRQCQRIFDDFSDEPRPLFVLLSPRGHRPRTTETDAARNAWATLSYPVLADLLEHHLGPHEPIEAGGRSAYDYLATLRKEFR